MDKKLVLSKWNESAKARFALKSGGDSLRKKVSKYYDVFY